MGLTEKHELWKKKVKDRKLFRELLAMSEEEINSAFCKELEFGTAGIRGIMGPGPNRFNIYTVRKISQGVALYMRNHHMKKVVISYDSRINSLLFAKEAACIFGSLGITSSITVELMPSPFLSFATRQLKADVGIMITASHNPREYNGYKVYDCTGCQITETVAKEIAANISQVDAFRLRVHTFDYYFKRGLVAYVDDKIEDEYLEAVKSVFPARADGLNVVYTPLNGTGYRIAPKLLESIGVSVATVPNQNEPSGKFLTCPAPNPEKKEALKHGIKLLKSSNADLLIATDPDADRIGIAYIEDDEAVILSGNQIGVIMLEYLLSHNKSVKDPLVVRTAVSTDLADKIASEYGAEMVVVPTGFKYIGSVINQLAEQGKEDRFVLGFEESQGYLSGAHVRDKDAIIASKLMAIIASELKKEGKNLGDKLKDIYERYGYYTDKQIAYQFKPEDGDKMKQLLSGLRQSPLAKIADREVTSVIDYLEGGFDYVKVDMLQYEFDGGRILVRPSGTEPLIKLYVSLHIGNENEKVFKAIQKQFDEIFK